MVKPPEHGHPFQYRPGSAFGNFICTPNVAGTTSRRQPCDVNAALRKRRRRPLKTSAVALHEEERGSDSRHRSSTTGIISTNCRSSKMRITLGRVLDPILALCAVPGVSDPLSSTVQPSSAYPSTVPCARECCSEFHWITNPIRCEQTGAGIPLCPY